MNFHPNDYYDKLVTKETDFLKEMEQHPCESEHYLAAYHFPNIGIYCKKCDHTFIGIKGTNMGPIIHAKANDARTFAQWIMHYDKKGKSTRKSKIIT